MTQRSNTTDDRTKNERTDDREQARQALSWERGLVTFPENRKDRPMSDTTGKPTDGQPRKLTKKDCGCWGDGVYGIRHVNRVLHGLLLRHVPTSEVPPTLLAVLQDGDEDLEVDAGLDAIDLLNTHATNGLVEFDFVDGDLVLLDPDIADAKGGGQ